MNLAKKAIRGVLFVGGSNYLLYITNFIGGIILARLLEPELFGIIALSQFFLSLSGRIKELGLEQGLINRQENWQDFANNHLSLQLILGIASIIINSLLSIVVYLRYGPTMGLVLFVSGLFGMLGAFSSTYLKIFEKELMFKQSTILDLLNGILAQVGMIFMAFKGFGVWSLVLGGLLGSVPYTLLIWKKSPVKLKLSWDKEKIKWFFNFGPWWHWFLAALASMIVLQFDNLLVGTILSAATLGFYSRAYNWATLPTSRLAAIISRVAYPIYAKLQSDFVKLSYAFNLTLSVIVRVTLPIGIIGLFIIREGTLFLIGEKWLALVPMFQALFLYMILRPLFDDTGALFMAVGKPKIINSVQVWQALLILAIDPILVHFFGAVGAGVGAGLAMLLGITLLYPNLKQIVAVDFIEVFAKPFLAGVVALILFLFLISHLVFPSLIVSLIGKAVIFLPIYLVVLFVLEGKKWLNYRELWKNLG